MATVLENPAAMNSSNLLSRRNGTHAAREPAENHFDGVDVEAIKRAVRTILRAVGEDPDRPGLLDTWWKRSLVVLKFRSG